MYGCFGMDIKKGPRGPAAGGQAELPDRTNRMTSLNLRINPNVSSAAHCIVLCTEFKITTDHPFNKVISFSCHNI